MINSNKKYGFTLMELMVAVIIIAVLAAVAVPQYKKAVLKSRFSTLMPVANSLAKGNEVYYLSQGEYSTEESKLDVEGQVSAPEGTEITLETDPEYLSYVRVSNESKVPNARYVVYQQHSKNFAGTTMCEAKDDTAKELCQSLGGVFVSENGTEARWTSYLLSGELGAGNAFKEPCPENAICNENDEVTGCNSGYYVDQGACSACPANSAGCDNNGETTFCASGYTLKDGECVACDITNAASCSTTSYAATSCGEGLCVQADGSCGSCDYAAGYCSSGSNCRQSTFGGNSRCAQYADCYGSTFSGESICSGNCNGDLSYGVTTFTDNARCSRDSCRGNEFRGHARCGLVGGSPSDKANCNRSTFTDNAGCTDSAVCEGSVFTSNSICTSTWACSGSTNSSIVVSTFKDNAVCAGAGCNTANYEGNACCAGTSCPSGVKKCVYNSQTGTYERDGVWP